MKCKDCNSTLCSYRTSDAEKNCFYESHPDYPLPRDLWNITDNTDWQSLRNQAAVAAMQAIISTSDMSILEYKEKAAREAVKIAREEIYEWLKENADAYTWYNEFIGESGMTDDFINDLKQAMKDE